MPLAVGVMAYTQAILEGFWAIVDVLVLSLVFTGRLMSSCRSACS